MRLSGVIAAMVAAIVAGALMALAYRSLMPRPRLPAVLPVAAPQAPLAPAAAACSPARLAAAEDAATRLSGEVSALREARIWLTDELARRRMAVPPQPFERYALAPTASLLSQPPFRRRPVSPAAAKPWAAVVLFTDPLK